MEKDGEGILANLNIYTNDNVIYRVSDEFLKLTGYRNSELIGKTFTALSVLLRFKHQLPVLNFDESYDIYIVNREDYPVAVKLSFKTLKNEKNKIYYFEQQEDSTLKFIVNNFADNSSDKNGSAAILTYPDCILLKHDDHYISTLTLMDIQTDDLIGNQPSYSKAISTLLKQGCSFHEFEVESISSSCESTYWDLNVKMLSGEGNRKYLVTSFYNVTKRVKERNRINKQVREMQYIVDGMSDVVNIIDKEGSYTYINKAGKQALSHYIPKYIPDIKSATSQMVYNAFEMYDNDAGKLRFEEIADQRVLKGETLSNHKIIGNSEFPVTYFLCDGTPIYDEQGNIEGGILVYKNMENKYKIDEYIAMKENIEDVSIYYAALTYPDFKISYLNEFAFQSFKAHRQDLKKEVDIIGKCFFNYYETIEVEVLVNNIKKSVENKSSYLDKNEFIKNGKTEYTKTIFQPILNQNNDVEKIIAIGIDISDEERASQETKKLLRAQEEIFINTFHELKTPLSLIFSGSQLLNLYFKKDSMEDVRDELLSTNRVTIENYYRLTKLINNILDISKMEFGLYELKLSATNIVEIIDNLIESISEYTNSKVIRILFDPEIEELMIALDVNKFEKILLNLISNAIKFSVTGRVILVKLAQKTPQTVSISVTDEGIGIDERDLEVIFEKFIRLNRNLNRIAEGNGLGLPLAKSIANLHGGSLSVESTLDQGSTFTLELPVKPLDKIDIEEGYSNQSNRVELIKYEFSDIYM